MGVRQLAVFAAVLVGLIAAPQAVPIGAGGRIVPVWPAGAAASPSPTGPSRAVPQVLRRRGQPGYNVSRGLRLKSVPGAKQPFFLGGRPSRTPVASTSRPPLSIGSSSTPLISVSSGLNRAGMASTAATVPPDSTGAIGPANYVEMVNSRIAVYDRSLNLVGTVTLNAFTGQPGLP